MTFNLFRNRWFKRFFLPIIILIVIVSVYPLKRYYDQNAAKKAMEKDGANVAMHTFRSNAPFGNDRPWKDALYRYLDKIISWPCYGISFENKCNDITLTHLIGFRDNSYIEDVMFNNCLVTGDGFINLKHLPQLKFVRIIHCHLGNTGLDYLSKLPRLRMLYVKDTPLMAKDFLTIDKLPNLKDLYIQKVHLNDFPNFKTLTKLENLSLQECWGTDRFLESLPMNPKIVKLHLDYSDVSDKALIHLKKFSSLEFLFLNGTNVSGDGLENIQDLPISWLDMTNTACSDKTVKYLHNLTCLSELNLSETKISDEGVETIQDLSIRALHLRNTFCTDRTIKYLIKMKNLSSVDLYGTKVTPTGLKELRKALPNLGIYPNPEDKDVIEDSDNDTERNTKQSPDVPDNNP